MSDETNKSVAKGFKSKRNKGIVFVGLCVLACKIPVLLVLLGVGGLGASASMFNFPPMAQSIGLALVVFSIVFGVIYFGYRTLHRANT